jgi:hypothetical protein
LKARNFAEKASTRSELVKAYTTDFCNLKALRDATREQVEAFVTQLADYAEKDPSALVCQLKTAASARKGCRMKRQITGLHAANRCAARFQTESSWFDCSESSFVIRHESLTAP